MCYVCGMKNELHTSKKEIYVLPLSFRMFVGTKAKKITMEPGDVVVYDIAGCDRMPTCERDYCLVAVKTTHDGLLPIIRVRPGRPWCTTAPMFEALRRGAAGTPAPVAGDTLMGVMIVLVESVEHITVDILIVTGELWDLLESRCSHQHVGDEVCVPRSS